MFSGNKIAALIGSALFSVISGFGQIADGYSILLGDPMDSISVSVDGYNVSIGYSIVSMDIEVVSGYDNKYFRVTLPDHISSESIGEPELPVWNKVIVVPEGYEYTVKIGNVVSKRILLRDEGIKSLLFPSQESESKSGAGQQPFKINKKLYRKDFFAGFDTVSIETIGKTRGKTVATLSISPMKYNPAKGIIDVIVSMDINVVFKKNDANLLETTSETPVFRELISSQTLNYNEEEVVPHYREQPAKMIVVTDSSFVGALDPFIKWKTEKGFDIIMLSVGEKLATYSSSELRDTIKNIYNNHLLQGGAPDYLLIAGNTSIIPYYEGAGSITDLYYGEMDGDGDYIPEIMIGRLPAADTTELINITSKIIQYEKYEYEETNEFASNALMFTGYDNTYSSIMNGQVRYGVENYLLPGNNINEYHFYHYTVTKDTLIKIINQGNSLINYTGHGTSTQLLSVNFRTADTVLMTNNNRYPVFISNACETSTFTTNSLGNIMVKAKEKGMVAFIGSSGLTYWNEDFYWSVGLATPSATPTYETTALGVFDRLFHTHGENAPEWYTSLGEIVYAGNMSVSASTSKYKKQYWERYNIVGDPSMIPIIGTPDSIIVAIPDTLPNMSNLISFKGEPFMYVALSRRNTLLSASHIGVSGVLNLEIPGMENDSILLVITGQNRIPFIKTLYINDVSNEFITVTSKTFNDDNGNNNGKAEFGESINMDISVSNQGSTDATGLYAKITSPSEWIEMITDSVHIGILPANTTTDLNNLFSFRIKDSIPNNYSVPIDLMLKDDYCEKHFEISLIIFAPSLAIASVYMDDRQTGNGDFIVDPGETFQLVYHLINEGDVAVTGNLVINADNTDILVSPIAPVTINPKSTTIVSIDIEQLADIPIGTKIQFETVFSAQPYEVSQNMNLKIGGIMESFEKGDFNTFPWVNDVQYPWSITTDTSFDGNISACSSNISHSQSSTLTINGFYYSADTLSFYYRVSSESSYDFLIFKINGENKLKVSGIVEWREIKVAVPPGYNKFEWIYQKDVSLSLNEDRAMVDMINFTRTQQMELIENDIGLYSIVSPKSNARGIENLSVSLYNLGVDTVKGFELGYRVNNGSEISQIFTDSLFSYGDTISVTFDQKIDLSSLGIYDIEVYNKEADDYHANDTIKVTIVNIGYDLEIIEIVSPVQSEELGREIVTVSVQNNGPEDISDFTLAYTINGVNKYLETFEENLIAYDNPTTVSFIQKANLSLYGEYEIKVFSELPADINRYNDTLTITLINNNITSLPESPYYIERIGLYPNPFDTELSVLIETTINAKAIIRIADISGKVVALQEQDIVSGENVVTIYGNKLSKGIYLIMIDIDGQTYTRKVIKQ
jgi:hypothetical protein